MQYLKSNDYEIIVLSTGPSSDIEELKQLGFEAIDIGSVVKNPIKAISFFYKMLSTIKHLKPKAIISFTIRPNIFGSIAARILNIPIVSNVTGTGPLTEDDSILYRVIRQMYKFAFQKNQCVFFQNESDMNYFLENNYVQSSQVKLLPGSGVDTEYYQPQSKTSSNFSFIMISRLIRDKGVMEYVKASRMIRKVYPDIECKLLGPFWTQSIGKNTITNEEVDTWVKNEYVNYLGYTLDVRPFIADTDCVVLPSYREGCANVLMQGASMAKPLIASDVTGCNNLINDEETGYLCNVKDAQSLAEAMMKMVELSHSEREAMGKKGREKMNQEYKKSIVLEAYETELALIV